MLHNMLTMLLRALKHLIEATQALGHPERIRVLGSSALLASFPRLGEPGQPLELSFDADLLIEPCFTKPSAKAPVRPTHGLPR